MSLTQDKVLTREEVFSQVLKAYGFKNIPDKLEFRVMNYATKRVMVPDSLPVMKTEDVGFTIHDPETGTDVNRVAYKRNTYDPSHRMGASGNPQEPQIQETFPVTSVALLYSFYVNDNMDNKISFAIGAEQSRNSTNGRGGSRVIMRVPVKSRIVLAPNYVINDVKKNMDIAMAMLMHPACEHSPLNWSGSFAKEKGLVATFDSGPARLQNGNNAIEFTCLTIKNKSSVERASNSAVFETEYISILTEMMNDDPFTFRTVCEAVGEVVGNSPNSLQVSFLNMIKRVSDTEFVNRVYNAIDDKSLTASALANKAHTLRLVKETDTGWAFAVGAMADIGAAHGLDGLAERISEDVTLRARLQHLCKMKNIAMETMEHSEEKERPYILAIKEAIQRGLETKEKPEEGAVYLHNASPNPSMHSWKDFHGTVIVKAGDSKDFEEQCRVLTNVLMNRVREQMRAGQPREAVMNSLKGYLGYKVKR